jgi:hypothetical protein
MANIRFQGKLTGAKARLFAHVCVEYSNVAEVGCNDTPCDHPIFSWLSPQQRLQLVHEVMVGLLCPDEPLPPETRQHCTTYLALVATIRTHVGVELDSVDDADVGDDLIDGYEDTTEYRRQTPEEREERIRNMDLISRQAEKNKEKFDRAQARILESQAGMDTSPLEAFHVRPAADSDYESRVSSTMSALFTGPPVPVEARRLNRLLTDEEEWAFLWRRLVDDALQENTNGVLGALRNVDFDWRCPNLKKWKCAINLLMMYYHELYITNSEQALVAGKIGEVDYADRSQHARIHIVEKIVKDLRDSYDPVWKPDMLAVDQRAIFAVCSSEIFGSGGHHAWVTGFLAHCEEEGVDFSAGGDYQKRLEIYRRMVPLYKEGLSKTYNKGRNFDDAKTPADFERYDPIYAMCHVLGCWNLSREALKLCSRCKIVSYCSRECQVKDWPDHKKNCKVLAELRKDKAKVSEIVKKRSR